MKGEKKEENLKGEMRRRCRMETEGNAFFAVSIYKWKFKF